MFGSKSTKNTRLAEEEAFFMDGGSCTRAELARKLGVSKGLVEDDLADLAGRNVMLEEGNDGALKLAFTWFRRR